MNKEELRKKYKIVRHNLKNKKDQSLSICNSISNHPMYRSANVVALYAHLEDEVDVDSLILLSLKEGKRVCLPKIKDNNHMEFVEITSMVELDTVSKFNIKEPSNNNVVSIEVIDLMICPGIAFDLNNNRIGFGKGYYDEYLSRKNNIYKIGVTFIECHIDEMVNTTSFDIPMNEVIDK